MFDDKSSKHVSFLAPNRYYVMDVSIGHLSYELTRKNDQKLKSEAHRLIITKHLTTSRKLTAISALFLMSSANSVLVSVTLFGAAILSSILAFPDVIIYFPKESRVSRSSRFRAQFREISRFHENKCTIRFNFDIFN